MNPRAYKIYKGKEKISDNILKLVEDFTGKPVLIPKCNILEVTKRSIGNDEYHTIVTTNINKYAIDCTFGDLKL